MPGSDDVQVTRKLASEIAGFKGHVVINSGRYAVIGATSELARTNVPRCNIIAITAARLAGKFGMVELLSP